MSQKRDREAASTATHPLPTQLKHAYRSPSAHLLPPLIQHISFGLSRGSPARTCYHGQVCPGSPGATSVRMAEILMRAVRTPDNNIRHHVCATRPRPCHYIDSFVFCADIPIECESRPLMIFHASVANELWCGHGVYSNIVLSEMPAVGQPPSAMCPVDLTFCGLDFGVDRVLAGLYVCTDT